MVKSVHQVSVIQRTLKLQLLFLKIPKRLSQFFDKLLIFTWIALIVSECSFSERKLSISLGKREEHSKTFLLTSLKKFSSESQSSSMTRKTLFIERVKM